MSGRPPRDTTARVPGQPAHVDAVDTPQHHHPTDAGTISALGGLAPGGHTGMGQQRQQAG